VLLRVIHGSSGALESTFYATLSFGSAVFARLTVVTNAKASGYIDTNRPRYIKNSPHLALHACSAGDAVRFYLS